MNNDPVTSIGQMLLFAGMNHGTSWAIVKGIDYLSKLTDEDLKEMTSQLSPEYAARFHAVAKAARFTVPVEVTAHEQK